MSLADHGWVCSICHRRPGVSIEVTCPQCGEGLVENFFIDFAPSGDASADHGFHVSEEQRFIKNHQHQHEYYNVGLGRFRGYLSQSFKEHITTHENWAFEKGATSRDAEIRHRLDELNKAAQATVMELTEEMLTKRQNDCAHDGERHWLPSAEAGRVNLVCDGCCKVLKVKFVGISSQHGESIALKIVREK